MKRTCPICFKQNVRLGCRYGALCCQYCKAFFKTVLKLKSQQKQIICQKSAACRFVPGLNKSVQTYLIGPKRAPFCRLCRFQRCLSMGMRPDWVRKPDLRVNVIEKENKVYISSPDYPDLPALIPLIPM